MPLMMITENGAIREMSEIDPDEAARLQRRLHVRERQLKAVRQISEALYSQQNIHDILDKTLSVALQTLDAEVGSILLYDTETKRLRFRYWTGSADLSNIEINPETDLKGKAAQVFREGVPLITDDILIQGYNPAIDNETGFHTRNMLTVPIIAMGGERLGVLQAVNKRYEPFYEDDSELLQIISSQAAILIINSRLSQEARLAAVAKAVGELGHDIKNYLTPISTATVSLDGGFVQPMLQTADKLMDEWKETSPEHAQKLNALLKDFREEFSETTQAIEGGCADILELVSEIADYLKGTAALHLEVQPIGEIITKRLNRLQIVAKNRFVTLKIEGSESIPRFAFDRRLVGRALYNLANNALGAIDKAVQDKLLEYDQHRYCVTVKLSVITDAELGECCLIEVQDNGYGVPPHVKDTLFTPQAISTTPGGTGLGTRFVRDVAEMHNGSVGVESEWGQGACFWMRLPLRTQL